METILDSFLKRNRINKEKGIDVMKYKIIVDSCCELPKEQKNDPHFKIIPLTLSVDDYQVVDDENFNQKEFIKRVSESPNCPKSACPSPEAYMQSYEGDYEGVFVVTLSANLSGSYNSAVLGANLYKEAHPDTKVYVFNSKSASVGETQIALRIQELAEAGVDFDRIVEQIEAFLEEMDTYFVLETLDALRKNGRLTNIQAVLANVLSIKPIMGANPDGTICKLDQVRGMNKALIKMADIIAAKVKRSEEKRLLIAHCNCFERAEYVKQLMEERIKVKDTIILDTAGVSTLYASDGGIIVTI